MFLDLTHIHFFNITNFWYYQDFHIDVNISERLMDFEDLQPAGSGVS